ncbi:MAG: beta-lactamase family protein [Anaerolineaceae bacterium]|nr:MAG: beta-lactamase family protein [Anaerolineaceae bacterium]
MFSQRSSGFELILIFQILIPLLLVVISVVGCTAQPPSVGVTATPTITKPVPDMRVTETVIPPTETLTPLPPITLDTRVAEIEALMTEYEGMNLFSGTVLVAERGEVIYEKAIGYANREWSIPNALDTRFRIASLSKQFTKVLVLQLVEEGKLSLDGTIALYLPDYTGPGADQITIDFLLTHRSGIVGESAVQDLERIERDYYTHEEMLELISGFDLLSEPGTQWTYSNFGYYLLGVIIERVSSRTYAELMQERICGPSGLTDTFPEVTSDIIERRASGYWFTKDHEFIHDSPLDMSFVFGYGHLISTVRDLYLFDIALREGKLLNSAHTNAIYTAEFRPIGDGTCEVYVVEDGPASVNGFRASSHSYIREDRFVVILENVRSGGYYLPGVFEIGRNIAAILYGCPYQQPAPHLGD